MPEVDELSNEDRKIVKKANDVANECKALIEAFQLRKGLEKAIEVAITGNRYFTHQKPWNTVDSEPETCARTLYVTVNLCKILGVLVEPYLPFTAENIWQQLNMRASVHETDWASGTECTIESGHQINEPTLLFEKVNKEDLQRKLAKIRE